MSLDLQAPDASALSRRYGAEPPSLPGWSPALDAILGHRSVRAYADRPLPEGTVELAVAAAQSAPSSSNLQAWSVIAVEDPERRARIEAVSGPNPQINAAPLLLVWLADLSRLRRNAEALGETAEGLDYLESFLLGAIDAALAAQNALVALESIGLGTCYIGAIRNNPEIVAAELGLPPETVAVFGLTVGYPDPERPAAVKPRLPQAAVLHRERYAPDPEPAALAAYDATLKAFQTGQGLAPTGWTRHIAARVATTAALKGRDALAASLRRLGFALK